jgi:hypothetical protein
LALLLHLLHALLAFLKHLLGSAWRTAGEAGVYGRLLLHGLIFDIVVRGIVVAVAAGVSVGGCLILSGSVAARRRPDRQS